tara:strand:+ start:7185 stop:7439 length:255 start_codon:yes stop_codon:yes gene_type:complete
LDIKGAPMATHSNVTFRTIWGEETIISPRYNELTTEQVKHILIQEQIKWATIKHIDNDSHNVVDEFIMNNTTKAFSDDTEIVEL